MKKIRISIAGLALLHVLVLSNTAIALPSAQECGDMANQRDMHVCFDQVLRRRIADMDKTYAELLKKLGDEKIRNLLRDSQAAWLSYRQKECDFEISGTEGGSIQPTISVLCFTDKTEARIKELESQLNCKEGDLSCVH